MKKVEEYNGIVERIDYPNKGVVRLDGITDENGDPVSVLVKRVLPGERIRLRLRRKRRGRWEGEKMETIAPGPDACELICPHAAGCGGCAYQGLSYEAQLALKEEQVTGLLDQALREAGEEGLGARWEGILPRVRPVTRHAVVASDEETEINPRARSAKLRTIERMAA